MADWRYTALYASMVLSGFPQQQVQRTITVCREKEKRSAGSGQRLTRRRFLTGAGVGAAVWKCFVGPGVGEWSKIDLVTLDLPPVAL